MNIILLFYDCHQQYAAPFDIHSGGQPNTYELHCFIRALNVIDGRSITCLAKLPYAISRDV